MTKRIPVLLRCWMKNAVSKSESSVFSKMPSLSQTSVRTAFENLIEFHETSAPLYAVSQLQREVNLPIWSSVVLIYGLEQFGALSRVYSSWFEWLMYQKVFRSIGIYFCMQVIMCTITPEVQRLASEFAECAIKMISKCCVKWRNCLLLENTQCLVSLSTINKHSQSTAPQHQLPWHQLIYTLLSSSITIILKF